jgi:hypothetical protein
LGLVLGLLLLWLLLLLVWWWVCGGGWLGLGLLGWLLLGVGVDLRVGGG